MTERARTIKQKPAKIRVGITLLMAERPSGGERASTRATRGRKREKKRDREAKKQKRLND